MSISPRHPFDVSAVAAGLAASTQDKLETAGRQAGALAQMRDLVLRALRLQTETIARSHGARLKTRAAALQGLAREMAVPEATETLQGALADYLRDRAERSVLFLDTLRQRGDVFIDHEAAGCPPVLGYGFDVALDGADLPRPTNYMLLRILPPEGVTIDEAARPYVIIDPRAGHGAGIGGFKPESQVGVALKAGSAVYFVSFRREPVPGQTIADVTEAEAEFVREVMRRHPDAPRPVVAGNCQGGWAALLLGATNPDLTGPLLLNGAPVGGWAGIVGRHPMRYNGGVEGGKWLAMLASDLGHGLFDGAQLVDNFEKLNPSRAKFGKYYDLFAKVDTEAPRFLEFERWWGGFFLMNAGEIDWIIDNVFVGNRLAQNEAELEPGVKVDLKAVRAPVIVFASHGDNITPPQQALNWIPDTYADVDEIRIRGQRIIYMVHESIGHLGIFVSGSVAMKEHTEVASVLETIESLAPGLYEMMIERETGEGLDKRFLVSFAERSFTDLAALDDGRADEIPFAAVARLSDLQAEAYEKTLRPLVRALSTPETAQALREAHPLRASRRAQSSRNPAMRLMAKAAGAARQTRRPVSPDNPFVRAERLWASAVEQSLDFRRDLRDASREVAFFVLYANPAMRAFGESHYRPRKLDTQAELQGLPEVRDALLRVRSGGFVEAVIRMLLLLADSRGAVRRDRLQRSTRMMGADEPFRSLGTQARAAIIHEQTLIVEFAREEAIAALPEMLPTAEERELAGQVILYVPGAMADMAPETLEMVQRLRRLLELPEATQDVTENPLAQGFGPALVANLAAAE